MHDQGTDRYLREYGGSDLQINYINWNAMDGCEQAMNISSIPTNFYTSPPGEIRGVTVLLSVFPK